MKKILSFATILLISGCSAINPFASNKPKMQEAPEVISQNQNQNYTQNQYQILWQQDIGQADKNNHLILSPALVETLDAIFVAKNSSNGKIATIQRIDAKSGQISWSKEFENPENAKLSGGVAADEDAIIVSNNKGDIFAYSTSDGEQLWKINVPHEISQPAAIHPQFGVAIKTADNTFYLFDKTDGKQKWIYQRNTTILGVRNSANNGQLAFADDFVFSGVSGGKIIALAAENGAPIWEGIIATPKGATELERITDVLARPLILQNGQLCAIAYQGKISCFNMLRGAETLWQKNFGSSQNLTADRNNIYLTSDDGKIVALDLQTGSTVWQQNQLQTRNPSAPIANYQQNQILVGDAEGFVYVIDVENGEFINKIQIGGGAIISTPIYSAENEIFYFQTENGSLIAVK